MDELLLVKLMLTAGLIFAASMVIVLMRGGDENEVSTGKPVGRLKRELMEAASALPWILAMGIIVWLVFGAKLFDAAIIDALRKHHDQGYR